MPKQRTFICATCGQLIDPPSKGNLIADDIEDENGKIIDLINWRVVHKVTCDPDAGPWHDLDIFASKNGPRFFKRMLKDGAFESLSADEIAALRLLLLGE